MQGITEREKAKLKLRALEILQIRPEINDSELGRVLGIDRRTAKVYRASVLAKVVQHVEQIEGRIAKDVMENVSIWQKIKSIFQ